jgi:protein involved in polysaccharide export with SLBB domain
VSLGKLKSINVTFVGEVKLPGIHPLHPFSTVLTGLIQAGGVDTTGSLRNIQIIRAIMILNR